MTTILNNACVNQPLKNVTYHANYVVNSRVQSICKSNNLEYFKSCVSGLQRTYPGLKLNLFITGVVTAKPHYVRINGVWEHVNSDAPDETFEMGITL